MKKFLSVVLTILLIMSTMPLGLFSITASAAEHTEGYYTYTIFDGKVMITEVDKSISGNVVIPSTLGGYPVTSIYGFEGCADITEITIPESVTQIYWLAFRGCTSLTEITIPENVTKIGSGIFLDCTNLKIVNYNAINCKLDDTQNIHIFKGCTRLTTVNIGENVQKLPSIFGRHGSITTVNYNAIDCDIDDTSLFQGGNVKVLNIGDKVKTIPRFAFLDCKIAEITIPLSVTSIGERAFNSNLLSIKVHPNNPAYYTDGNCIIEKSTKKVVFGCENSVIPEGVSIIGKWAFDSCSFSNIIIPKSVTSIEENAFKGCSELEKLTMTKNTKNINVQAFEVTAIKKLIFYGTRAEWNNMSYREDPAFVNVEVTCICEGEHVFDNAVDLSCNNCDYISGSNDAEETGCNSTGHKMGNWSTTKEATCEAKGEKTRSCSKCSYKETEAIDALGHKFDNPTITKQPTCTETGIESGKCTRCNKETTNIIKATGHKLEKYTVTLEPTCTAEGKKEGTCTTCGVKAEETISAKGHTFGDAVVTKEATETETGLKTKTCTVCGETEEEIIAVLGAESEAQAQDGGNSTIIWIIIGIAVAIAAAVIVLVIVIKKK